MLNRHGAFVFAVLCAAAVSSADVIQLGDGASVTGKILAEKADSYVVDLGYTVLVIPREHVVQVLARAPRGSVDASTGSERVDPTVEMWAVEERPGSGFYKAGKGDRSDQSVRDLVRQLGESVVQIRTPGGSGSGFFINEEGYLITNFHVIERETRISVDVYHAAGDQIERKVYRHVRIVAMNKFADLALLKIDSEDTVTFTPAALGRSSRLAVGERLFAIGSPLGLERTVTEGILSTKTRPLQGDLFLQTTAEINPGNSGGPLFNLQGEVIGVTNMKVTYGEGIGFAIPVERVLHFLDHRDAFAYDNDNPSNPYRYLEPPSRMKQSGAGHGQ